jgi:ankyrin repeat protein
MCGEFHVDFRSPCARFLAGAKELLVHGANINAADKRGTTPLMAAMQKNRSGFMEMCLQLGVDFSLKDDQGRTALSLAVCANRLALCKRLLAKYPGLRETVNTPDILGRTPIIHAAINGSLEMAGLLIDYEADVIHMDSYGKDAADYAGAAGFVDLARVSSEQWNGGQELDEALSA